MNHAALAGGVAGVVESIVVQPLDIVKTRFQLSREANPKLPGTCIELDRLGKIVSKKPFDLNIRKE